MEVLETINEVFAFNLRRYRKKKEQETKIKQTQARAAEAVGVSHRQYQRYESEGIIPERSILSSLSRYLSVPETALFLDPDLAKPSPAQALELITQIVKRHSI